MKLWKKKQVAALSLAVLMALPGCQTPDPGTSGSGTSDPSAQQVEAAAGRDRGMCGGWVNKPDA